MWPLIAHPRLLVAALPGILIALTFHEYAHAWASDRMGDPTPRHMGRLTLNPLPHLDPIGTLCLLFMPIGWAKPVPVNPSYWRKRYAEYVVSLAGVTMNLALALAAGAIIRLVVWLRAPLPESVLTMLVFIVLINVGLMIFNLLPIPPLDGSHVLRELLPLQYKVQFDRIRPYGPIIILVLAVSGGFGRIISGPIQFIVGLVLGS